MSAGAAGKLGISWTSVILWKWEHWSGSLIKPEHITNQKVFKGVYRSPWWTQALIRPHTPKSYLMWGIGKCTVDESEVCVGGCLPKSAFAHPNKIPGSDT